MESIKKMWKEISVFGLVLVIFLGLFIYRNATYATYKTISTSKLESKLNSKSNLVFVAGKTGESDTSSYLDVVTKYCTKHKNQKVYYVNVAKDEDFISTKLKINTTVPCTFVVKNGEVVAHKDGTLGYYQLYDFIKENV